MAGPLHARTWLALVILVGGGCRSAFDDELRQGNEAAAAGALLEARGHYERATTINPSSDRAPMALAEACFALGDIIAAKKAWEAALSLRKSNRALEGLAAVALEEENSGLALDLLSKRGPPIDPAADVLEARALLARGAPADLERALTLSRSARSPQAQYVEGSALLALHRYADAQAAFEALSADAKTPLGPYGLARVAAAQERGTDVLLYLARAKSAWGAAFPSMRVATDPAFAFMAESREFSELVRGSQ